MTPDQEQRREAVRIARAYVHAMEGGELGLMTDLEQLLICRTLLAAQRVFAERLAPVYAAAMDAVEADGRIGTMESMLALCRAVMAARAREQAE